MFPETIAEVISTEREDYHMVRALNKTPQQQKQTLEAKTILAINQQPRNLQTQSTVSQKQWEDLHPYFFHLTKHFQNHFRETIFILKLKWKV